MRGLRSLFGSIRNDGSRPRRVLIVLVTLAALILGLGGGTAYAYFTGTGSGGGHATVGTPVNVTITAVSGTADLLPGGTGAATFTLTNTNKFGASFSKVATGATVVSNNTGACPSSNVSIAQTLPYTFSPAATVAANNTSTQSIANLVALSASAPSTCQGVTFTVTLTLSGQST